MRYVILLLLIITGLFLALCIDTCIGIITTNDYIVPIVLNGTYEYESAIAELIGSDFGILIFLGLSLIIFSWLLGIYRRLSRKKRTKSTTRIDDVKKPYILYLRSFADEKSTKKIIKRLSDNRSEEEMLIDAFSDIAPVYAIGDPADKKMPYGATRIYVDDSIWKQTVENLASNAEIVILRLGKTNNFWWEVNMALKKVPIEKIVFVIPWSKNFNNVSTLYKILLEHNIDISSLNVTIDKKRHGSISSVLFFKGSVPVSNEITIPRFTGIFLSYDKLIKNALLPFREKYGFNSKKELPILKSRLLTLTLLLMIVFSCGSSYFGHYVDLKYQRPYELVEECIKNDDFVSKYSSEANGTNLTWAIIGSQRGQFLLNNEDYIKQFLIEKEVLNQLSSSESEHLDDEPFNLLLMIKKYSPEHYQEYIAITSKAALRWIKNPKDAADALLYYKQNINNLPEWVHSFMDKYGEVGEEQFNNLWIEESMKHLNDPDFPEIMKTLIAQTMNPE